MGKKRVFVTGMGVVCSIGKNVKDFSASLKNGTSGIVKMEQLKGLPFGDVIGAPVRDFTLQKSLEGLRFLPENIISSAFRCAGRSPFTVQVSVSVALEAWEQSGLHRGGVDPERIGIIAAGHNISQRYHYEAYLKYGRELEYLNPRYPLHYMDTDHVGTISEILGIKGEGFTVGDASATGNAGILKGCQMIQIDSADVCMVVAPPADLSPLEVQGFYNMGAMGGRRFSDAPEKACRPFDRDHEGFIYGQGAGCLILESMESMQKRGGTALAEIQGASLVLDANRLSNPSVDGEARAMVKALNSAEIGPSDINYINAHGSSSPLGDEVELKAIKRVFEKELSNIWINSTKGLIGHCLYSAAVIEAIAVIIQMQEGFVHGNINLENPVDNDFLFVKSKYENASIEYALSNSFGFGGINTSIVLKRSTA
ncbi:MAG: beta-ketoacyl synthase N-terminal-like domain-containing protein [Acetivibrionales bacterium]|jgi:malonyl-ACP decarboxylase